METGESRLKFSKLTQSYRKCLLDSGVQCESHVFTAPAGDSKNLDRIVMELTTANTPDKYTVQVEVTYSENKKSGIVSNYPTHLVVRSNKPGFGKRNLQPSSAVRELFVPKEL